VPLTALSLAMVNVAVADSLPVRHQISLMSADQ
jgi:hypothetical protein